MSAAAKLLLLEISSSSGYVKPSPTDINLPGSRHKDDYDSNRPAVTAGLSVHEPAVTGPGEQKGKITGRDTFGCSRRRKRQTPAQPARDVWVSVRLSRDERTVLWQAAARANMTMGRFIVGAVYGHALRLLTDARFSELQAARADLVPIGRNINQAVKRLHTTGYGADLVDMRARLYATLDRIDAAAR